MENSTGQLDKLIEKKVDKKIEDFSRSLTEQINKFLKDNGDYTGDWLYVVTDWERSSDGTYGIPIKDKHISIHQMRRDYIYGLSLVVKDKMIKKETEELLEKVNLLTN